MPVHYVEQLLEHFKVEKVRVHTSRHSGESRHLSYRRLAHRGRAFRLPARTRA